VNRKIIPLPFIPGPQREGIFLKSGKKIFRPIAVGIKPFAILLVEGYRRFL
jgi:hypothetical protein